MNALSNAPGPPNLAKPNINSCYGYRSAGIRLLTRLLMNPR
jgi:hypothetical protein